MSMLRQVGNQEWTLAYGNLITEVKQLFPSGGMHCQALVYSAQREQGKCIDYVVYFLKAASGVDVLDGEQSDLCDGLNYVTTLYNFLWSWAGLFPKQAAMQPNSTLTGLRPCPGATIHGRPGRFPGSLGTAGV